MDSELFFILGGAAAVVAGVLYRKSIPHRQLVQKLTGISTQVQREKMLSKYIHQKQVKSASRGIKQINIVYQFEEQRRKEFPLPGTNLMMVVASYVEPPIIREMLKKYLPGKKVTNIWSPYRFPLCSTHNVEINPYSVFPFQLSIIRNKYMGKELLSEDFQAALWAILGFKAVVIISDFQSEITMNAFPETKFSLSLHKYQKQGVKKCIAPFTFNHRFIDFTKDITKDLTFANSLSKADELVKECFFLKEFFKLSYPSQSYHIILTRRYMYIVKQDIPMAFKTVPIYPEAFLGHMAVFRDYDLELISQKGILKALEEVTNI